MFLRYDGNVKLLFGSICYFSLSLSSAAAFGCFGGFVRSRPILWVEGEREDERERERVFRYKVELAPQNS